MPMLQIFFTSVASATHWTRGCRQPPRARCLYAHTVPWTPRPVSQNHHRFDPGSGWYRPGAWSPNSLADRRAMREAAIACTVVVLYRSGQRIPTRELLLREPPSGWLVCRDLYTAPAWYACLFADSDMKQETVRLMRVQLE